MDLAERLSAIEAIKQLKARYVVAVDAHDYDAVAAVFTDDAVLDLELEKEFHRGRAVDRGPADPPWLANGREEIRTFISEGLSKSVSVHEVHTPIIELSGADTATGTWGLHDYISFPDGSWLHGYGRYHESYRKVEGNWLIVSMEIRRIRVDWSSAGSSVD